MADITEIGQAASEVQFQDEIGKLKNRQGEAVLEVNDDQEIFLATSGDAVKIKTFIDDDAFGVTATDTALATAESIKAYVDASGGGSGAFTDLAVDTSTLVANVAGYTDKVGVATATPRRTLDVLDASNPQLRLSRVDNTNYVDMTTTAADNLLKEGSHATNFYDITRASTNAYALFQAGASQVADDSGKGLSVGVTGTTAYIWMRGTGAASGTNAGKLNIGAGGTGGLTIDADNDIVALEGTFQLKAEQAAPSAPGSGDGGIIYVKTDGIPYYISDSTAETSLVGALNSAPADETYSGTTATFTAGEALSRGEVVYFKAVDSKMWKAVASAEATSRCVAMAAADIAADATGTFLLQGFLTDNGTFPAYTVGGVLYTPEAETVSENVPEQTAPDTTGDFVQVIGWAVTANTIYFDPDSTIIEIA